MDSNSPRSPLDEGEIGDDESKEFDDGFDENLMGDDEDKRKLAQMTEKEREQELFNRSERRETLKIRFEIERKLRSKAKKRELEKKQSKQVRARKRLRASEVYSSDGSSDESDEYTPDTDKSSTLNDINTSGKPTSKINTRSHAGASALLSSSSSASSVASDSSESDREDNDLGADEDSRIAQDDFQMTLADLRSLQLTRQQIADWIYTPFFKETAIGLFVRISISNDPVSKMAVYKVAQIVDITKGNQIYSVSDDGKNRTDKCCLVRIGGMNRTFRMCFVSNRGFEDDDYTRWRDALKSDEQGMPSREHFNRKRRDLQNAINYVYKTEDIDYQLQERSRFQDSPNNFVLKKAELQGEKSEAEAANDYEKARRIQLLIDELEEQAKKLEKSRNSSTFSAISFVNERNRIKNIEESERVLKESKSVKTEDPFTRRKCTPMIVHNRNNNGDISKSFDKNGDTLNNTANSDASKNNGAQKVEIKSLKSADDLFQAHASIDLELDIDI